VTDDHHILLALTNPLPGLEADYEAWYDTYHLPEISSLPHMVRAQRFKFSQHQITGPAGVAMPSIMPHFEYLATYEIRGPLDETLAAMTEARETGALHTTDALDRTNNAGVLYTAHRPPLVR
jgi:hypothetical protein